MLEKSPCSHNIVVLISPDFDRACGPDVVQVDGAVPCLMDVFEPSARVAEPCSVQRLRGLRFRFFEAFDELAVGRAGVP